MDLDLVGKGNQKKAIDLINGNDTGRYNDTSGRVVTCNATLTLLLL